MKILFLGITVTIIASACVQPVVISEDDPVRKQVEACGAGFSTSISTKLLAQYDIKKTELQGEADAGVSASSETATALLPLLPEADRLDGYKAYAKCLTEKINYPEGKAPPPEPILQTGSLVEKKNYG